MSVQIKQATRSTANLFYVFISAALIVALIASYFLIGERIRATSLDFQQRSTQAQAEYASRALGTYLDDRILLLQDLATQPILANAVMGTLVSEENLLDYLDAYRIFGKLEHLYLLDILGQPVYQSTDQPLGIVLEDEIWFQQIVEGERPWAIRAYRGDNGWHFALTIPVEYNGASEGAILVRFRDNLRELVSSLDTGSAIHIVGEHINYSTLNEAVEYRLIDAQQIGNTGLKVEYFRDADQLASEVNNVVQRAYLGIIGSLLIAFIFLFLIGKKFFVDPFKVIEQSERQLREQQDRNRELLEALNATPTGVTVADARRKDLPLIYVNKSFEEITGYSADESIGVNCRFLTGEKTSPQTKALISRLLKAGKPVHVEILNYTKDNKPFWNDLSISPVYNDHQELTAYVGVQSDITEKIERQRELEESREQAQSASQAKSEFLANMSHEIRTPMNGVIGMTNLLLDTELNEEQREFAETVKNSADSLLSIINDILDYSKVEAGKLELEPIEFNIGSLMDSFGTEISVKAGEKDVEIICPANPVLDHWYMADPGRIRQILHNLVGNAIKFTEQGEVAVYLDVLEESDAEALIKIRITDTGIGLTEEQISRLFDRFEQADGSTTRKYGGTGLGLAISKQLVELMGGEIGVESTPGEGSTFWFTMRLEETERPMETDYMVSPSSEKVLVVDDNRTSLRLMNLLLERWGIEHELANHANHALERLLGAAKDGNPFTIMITDHQMPEIDGFDLADLISEHAELEGLKKILLSSAATRGDASLSQSKGFSGFLTKPIEQDKLYGMLMKVSGVNYQSKRLITRYTLADMPNLDADVLLVEDNPTNQLLGRRLLEKYGLRITITEHGEEALAALREKSFDLVFMDCQMPVMDGFEATRRIRAGNDPRIDDQITIVAMTANAMEGDRQACLDVGMNDYLAKPIIQEELQQVLLKWLTVDSVKSSGDAQKRPKISANIFNFAAFAKRMMDDYELMQEVAQSFITETEPTIRNLINALESHDSDRVHELAIKIKGVSSNVEAGTISSLAEQIEHSSNHLHSEQISELTARLAIEFDSIKQAFQQNNLLA